MCLCPDGKTVSNVELKPVDHCMVPAVALAAIVQVSHIHLLWSCAPYFAEKPLLRLESSVARILCPPC